MTHAPINPISPEKRSISRTIATIINPFSENKFVTGYFNIWLLIGFCCNFPSHFKMGTDCFPNIIKSAFSDRNHAVREKFPHVIIVTWVFRSVNLGIVTLSAISSAI